MTAERLDAGHLHRPRVGGNRLVGDRHAGSVAACTPSAATVTCVLPTLESDESVTLLIQILAPGAGGTIALDGTLTIDAGGGNPSSASKDTFKDSDALDVVDSPDFFGRGSRRTPPGRRSRPTPVGGTNGQSTSVFVPAFATGYAAFLQESNDALLCNGAGVAGFGKTVEMHFANGLSPVTVTLTYNRVTAGNKTPATTSFVHQLDNGQCEFPPAIARRTPGFCFDAFWQGSGPNRLLIIQAELGSNGRGARRLAAPQDVSRSEGSRLIAFAATRFPFASGQARAPLHSRLPPRPSVPRRPARSPDRRARRRASGARRCP